MVAGSLAWIKLGGGGAQPPRNTTSLAQGEAEPTQDIPVQAGVENLLLSDASDIWTDKVIPLAKAAQLWVEVREDKESTRPIFHTEAINSFYIEHIVGRKYIYGKKKAAIIAILNLLDKHGNCPSVVRNPKFGDSNNKFSDEAFQMLAQTTLCEHSLGVAATMARKVSRDILIPDALIVSLAHDLGKIPAYHEKGYSTGDHPIIATIVLGGISEFTELSNQSDLFQIIRQHHDLNPSAMAAILKESDGITRNKELAAQMKAAVDNEGHSDIEAHETSPTQKEDEKPQASAAIPVEVQLPIEAEATTTAGPLPIAPEPTKGAKYVPTRIAIPWFNPDAMLGELKKWINYTSEHSKWGAVSMPDGLVYVNGDCLWGVIKKTAPEEIRAELQVTDTDEARKRNIMFSAVWTLSEERNAIAADMLNPNYYMIPVTILNGNEKPVVNSEGRPYLMAPFRAEAFGVLPSELENKKTPVIRKLVKSIKPAIKRG
jgi:hypothetical protein